MSNELPNKPDLDQLRKQAKELGRDFAEAKPKAVARVRKCFADMSPPTPLSSSRAHLVLAREHGLASWAKLLAAVTKTPRDVKVQLKREDGRVYIAGLERMRWGQGKNNTHINSLRVAAKAFGDEISYDELMAFSGAAFRVQLHQPNWCPSAADAGPGYNCGEKGAKWLGYEQESVSSDAGKRDQVWARVCESIDDGRPVLGVQLVGPPDWGIAAGYDRARGKLLCRSYYDKSKHYTENTGWPFVFIFLRKCHPRRDPDRMLSECLDRAIMLATTESFPGGEKGSRYLSGYAALETWAKQLRGPEDLSGSTHANAFCYQTLTDARGSAGRFLKDSAERANEDASKHLTQAGATYEKIAGILAERSGNAPFPWEGKWTVEQRRDEADTLDEVLALERTAIAAIDKARRLIEPGGP